MADRMCEFETVHRAWHVNVGKDHTDVSAALQYRDGFIGVCGLDDLIARVLEHFGRA